MKKIIFMVMAVFLLLNIPISSFAQSRDEYPEFDNLKKVGQSGYQFLKIGVGARGTAMGGAAITNEGNAGDVFYNPAGLTAIEGKSVFVGYTNWFADIKHQAFSAAINLGKLGVFGLNGVMMDHGDIMGTAIANNNIGYEDTGNLDVAEMAIGLSYARRFTDRFGLGGTIKYCRQDLDAMESSVVAFDIGTIYNTGWHDVKVAMSIQHFSKEIRYIDEDFVLPLTYRIGVSANLLSLMGKTSEKHDWTIAFEGVNPRDYTERFHLGTEYWFDGLVALRGGYKFNYDEEGITFGAGVKMMGVEIGYAYADFGDILGTINRVSAQLSF